MLAMLFNAVKSPAVNKNELVIDIAKRVSVLTSMTINLGEIGITKEAIAELERLSATIDNALDNVEALIKAKREDGDIHYLRALNDLRRQKAVHLNYANELLKPLGVEVH